MSLSEKRQLEVCYTPKLYSLFHQENCITVVVDVLRATSAICTAFDNGVEKIIPVASVDEAREYLNKGYIVGAERGGEIVEGFEFGNSPFSYMKEQVEGKTLVLSTTNGTRAIEASKGSDIIAMGSFLNLNALSKWITEQDKHVVVFCAGYRGRFNMEDTLFAGALAAELMKTDLYESECDSTIAAKHLYALAKDDLYGFLENTSHRNRLQRLDLEKDVRYCLELNEANVVPVMVDDALKNMI
ncbi:MAG: 2-phosphosulfolactate phosphatase [Flavobacteriales bacterium]|nr:2-phosphosulfolactate phosphatase [Flavobacteriales bacterium]